MKAIKCGVIIKDKHMESNKPFVHISYFKEEDLDELKHPLDETIDNQQTIPPEFEKSIP